jgi:integrase
VKFPVTIKFYDQRAKIYRPAKNFPHYRVAFKVAGKRRMLTFSNYGQAKAAAEEKVKELHKGQQSSALTAKESQDAIAIRQALDAYRRDTGRKISAFEAITSYIAAAKLLPDSSTLPDAVRAFRQTIAAVQRKPLVEAVTEFCAARQAKTAIAPGKKRPGLNPVYVADTTRQLNEFTAANPAADVCDLTKQHLDLFMASHGKLSAKSRNHVRATLRMFFGWCVRLDYLPANHRLLEADGLRNEDADDGDIDFYRPDELQMMLENASAEMRPIVALQALGGLRLQEALRLNWHDVFKIPDHVEVASAKSKTRSRRLVEINPALAAWLEPHRGNEGNVSAETLHSHTWQFIQLRKRLKIPPRRNGLRHGFLTAHYALHHNENETAAQAGTSPAMLFKHYKGLTTKSEAEKWFAVMPPKTAKNVIPLKAASRA